MRFANSIVGICLLWLQWAIQPCLSQGCSYGVFLEYPTSGQTLTAAATDTEPFTQQFVLSVLSGYSCPGNFIAQATLYANGETEALPDGTIPLNTGYDYITATYDQIALASLTPQVIEFVLSISNTADDLLLTATFPATIVGSGGGTGTTPVSPVTTPPVADPCPTYSPCVEIGNAINSCEDDACFCPTLLAYGSQCSSCFVPVNTTEAAGLSLLMSECRSEGYGPLTTTGGGPGETTPGTSKVTTPSLVIKSTPGPTTTTPPVFTSTATATPTTSSSGKSSAAQKRVSFSPVLCGLLAVLGASFFILFT